MVVGGSSSKNKEIKNHRSRQSNDNNTLPSAYPYKHRSQVRPIYCHQCRRRMKETDLLVTCKNRNGIKPCSLKFCGNCLLKSDGDKASETCPRCRGVCLCSTCRKKQRVKEDNFHVRYSTRSAGIGTVLATTNGLKRKKPIPTNNDIQRKKGSFDKPNEESHKILAKKQKMESLEEEVKNDNIVPEEPEKTMINAEKPAMESVEQNQRNDMPKVSEDIEDGDNDSSCEEIEPEIEVPNGVLFCDLTPKEDQVKRDVEENYEHLDYNNREKTDIAADTEIPHQGNVFQRSALKLFRWFVGSA